MIISGRPWHQAMAYALLGQRLNLGLQSAPDLAGLLDKLRADGLLDALAEHVAEQRVAEQPWPHPIPEDLSAELSPSQLAALLRQAQELLGIGATRRVQPAPSHPPSRDDERLLREVPPHHGR